MSGGQNHFIRRVLRPESKGNTEGQQKQLNGGIGGTKLKLKQVKTERER